MLLLAMAGHSTLAKVMYGYSFPRVAQGATDHRAMLKYYGDDMVEIAIAIALFAVRRRRGARERRSAQTGLRVGIFCQFPRGPDGAQRAR